MSVAFVAFSLILSATSLGDEIEFSRPSLELYEEFVLSGVRVIEFAQLRERANELTVDELLAVRDDVYAVFSHDLTDEYEPTHRRLLVTRILSYILASGLFEKEHVVLVEIYEKFREKLIDLADKPAETRNEKGLVSTTRMFYWAFLSELVYNFRASNKANELLKVIMENTDSPATAVRSVALQALLELIEEEGADSVDKEEVAKALSRVKDIENTIQGMDISALQEWPHRGLESTTHSETNLRRIQQIEELLEQ